MKDLMARLERAENAAAAQLSRAEALGEWRHLSAYQEDPLGYAREVLGVLLTADQEEMLLSIRDHRRTAVKASHATGKTFVAAVAACWWYDCWESHISYITAPTWGQALGLTFKQTKLFRRRSRLPGEILETGLVRDTDKTREPGHFIKALNAETGEGFQGEHSAPLLVLAEEGPGVPHYIWEAADGLMTHPDCRLLAIGNPTDQATDFGRACESSLYHVLSVSALTHPNLRAEMACQPPPFPGAVRLLWVREMLEKECEALSSAVGDSFEWWDLRTVDAALSGQAVTPEAGRCHYLPTGAFQARVLGEFPTQADEKIIPRGWLTNLPPSKPSGVPEIGCDPARFGSDRTAIAVRQGACALSLVELRQMDLDAITGMLRSTAAEAGGLGGCDPKQVPLHIDVTGGLGAGPADALKAAGYNVDPVNSSSKAADEEQYPNRRSELWFTVRERARTKDLDLSRLPKEQREKLIRELSTPAYKVNGRGHKVAEEKAETKKRLGESPDVADAFNLSFAASHQAWWQDEGLREYLRTGAAPLR
jgi:hypothetical protein